MIDRLIHFFSSLTKPELKEIDNDVVLAIYKIRENPRQLHLAKKLVRLVESKEQ